MRTSPLPAEPAGSTSASPRQGCYLLHFEQPYRPGRHPGAQHYVGYADDIERRIQTHRKGHGSPLVAAVLAVGIDVRLVRTWPGADRRFERKLHNRHGSRLCLEPECVSEQRRQRLQLRLRLEAQPRRQDVRLDLLARVGSPPLL